MLPAQRHETVESANGVPAEEHESLRRRAGELVQALASTSGSDEMALLDGLTRVGEHVQRSGGAELDVLRARVGDLLGGAGGAGAITSDLVELRDTLELIDPDRVARHGLVARLRALLPGVPGGAPGLRALRRLAVRYESVASQVGLIERRLREGRAILARDNAELRQLYRQVEEQQAPLRRNVALGELIMTELEALLTRTTEPARSARLENALHDVAMRVQDLRTMQQVCTQFFVSIDLIRQNNSRLGQGVERTLGIATNVLVIGLAIHSSLSREKAVGEVTVRTQEFLGGVLAANAAAIRRHTNEIGEIYGNPVIAVEKLRTAHQDLLAAMEGVVEMKQRGVDRARDTIAQIAEMSSEMEQRRDGLRALADAEPASIEA